MAVALQAFDVVLCVEGVAQAFPGGLEGFRAAIPNSTYCSDGTVCRIGFMTEQDRSAFVDGLIRAGLTIHVDFESLQPGEVGVRGLLETGRYGGVAAAWRAGTDPEPLVVPLRYYPAAVTFYSSSEIGAHCEHLGCESGVEVYVDRRTGQKIYVGRTQSELAPEQAERIEGARLEAMTLLRPFLPLEGRPKPPGFFAKRKINKGLLKLQTVFDAVPNDGPSLWVAGMIHRALGDHGTARDYLARAHAADPSQKDFGREYAGQLMIMGESAVRVSRLLCERFPDDAGLRSNLGLALLIAGQPTSAEAEVQAALKMQPGDPITHELLGIIKAVREGRRQAPLVLPGWD